MGDKGLSARRKSILDFIIEVTRERGYPPTVREIGDAVGLKSSSTVHFHLNVLQKMGLIERDGSLTRAIRARDAEAETPALPIKGVRYAPLLGRVAAGEPIFAAENIEDTLTLPAELFPDGDLLVVQRQATARDGDIVVALLEDEATVKRFFRRQGEIELRPENSTMKSIVARDVQILGLVRGVIRTV